MDSLLSTINSPKDLKGLSHEELGRLAAEMREALCRLASTRTAHFASNLGVVELTLGAAHHVRFRPRPLDLGHRPSGLRPQDGDRPLRRVPDDAQQGRVDGLSQPGRERLRPVRHRPRRMQRRHRAGNEMRRRSAAARRESPRRGGRRRRRLLLRRHLRGHEQRRRTEEEPHRHPQRQQDVDLPPRGRAGRIARSSPHRPLLHRPEGRGAKTAHAHAGDRRAGRAVPLADEGRHQGRFARRNDLRGSRFSLHRAGRWAQRPPIAEVSEHGPAGSGPGAAARRDRERATDSSPPPTTPPPSTRPPLSNARTARSCG